MMSEVVAGVRFDEAVPRDSSFIGNKRYTQLSSRKTVVQTTNTNSGSRTSRLNWQFLDVD